MGANSLSSSRPSEPSIQPLEGSFHEALRWHRLRCLRRILAAVTFISDSYGFSDVQRILQRLSQGNSTEAALRATIHSDYGQFEMDLGRYLADKFESEPPRLLGPEAALLLG